MKFAINLYHYKNLSIENVYFYKLFEFES